MMFQVGQKVVCVDDRNGSPVNLLGAGYAHGLRNGAVYTIAVIQNGFCALEEIKSRGRVDWYLRRFRPLAEKKADMEARNELFRKWETHKEKRVTAPLDEQA